MQNNATMRHGGASLQEPPNVRDNASVLESANRFPQHGADAPALPVSGFESLLWEYDGPYALVSIFLRALRERAFYKLCKRALDITVSLVLLVVSSPLFLAVAILVKCTSPGSVFFRHKRLGQNGKEFWCVKFRTMLRDAEKQLQQDALLRKQFEATFKIKHDPRVTRLGAFLRKTSIDELPQLLQVLRGDMTLIGPRPIVMDEMNKYGIYSTKLLTVKPGLSGFWQACGRSNTSYAERVQMDMFYIDNRCLFLDLVLLLLTVVAVLRKSGSY